MPDLLSTVGAVNALDGSARLRIDELDFFMSHLEASLSHRQALGRPQLWREMWDNFLVNLTGGGLPSWIEMGPPADARWLHVPRRRGRAHLKDPESHQIIETMAAQGMAILLGQPEYIGTVPIGYDDYDKARLVSRLIQSQLEMPNSYGTFYRTMKESFILGAAILGRIL